MFNMSSFVLKNKYFALFYSTQKTPLKMAVFVV